jgi:arylsulfatase A-like enzyme
VLIIVADDLGYHDVGFQGSREIATPHLDALAARSLRCTQGYVNHAFCSPTRAALLTGRYQHRFGHEGNPVWKPDDIRAGLARDQITLPEVMAKAGYATGMVGKWHLGAHPELHPMKRGFQEYYGILGGGHVYFPGEKGGAEYSIPMNRNGVDEPQTQYLTTALGEEAAAYVQRHAAGKPWLLYLAFNAPHTPLQAPPQWLKKMEHIQDESRRTYAAMIGAMDEAIGMVTAKLDATQQREHTLVFFVSDNGGPDLSKKPKGTKFTDNSPLRGAKGEVYEGGIRVPFLISLPGKLKPGTYTQPIIASDFFATAVALAGGQMPADRPMDSVDLMPYLTGQKQGAPHTTLHWRTQGSGGNHALRQGDWKLVKLGAAAPELYDLGKDVAEQANVAAQHPDVVAELEAKRQAWSAGMMEPSFASPSGASKGKGKGQGKAKK